MALTYSELVPPLAQSEARRVFSPCVTGLFHLEQCVLPCVLILT